MIAPSIVVVIIVIPCRSCIQCEFPPSFTCSCYVVIFVTCSLRISSNSVYNVKVCTCINCFGIQIVLIFVSFRLVSLCSPHSVRPQKTTLSLIILFDPSIFLFRLFYLFIGKFLVITITPVSGSYPIFISIFVGSIYLSIKIRER